MPNIGRTLEKQSAAHNHVDSTAQKELRKKGETLKQVLTWDDM